tara:strand:+ start:4824 stop:5264 length:441 start_codon:yes stop_codon:yes gene_type:complete
MFLFIKPIKANEFGCLTEALYHEARSEDDVSVLAVGTIILNRVKNKRFPNTICKVIHQGVYWQDNPVRDMCQFSYWCDGRTEKYKDIKALSRILRLAKIILSGIIVKTLDRATHYHASYVSPGWANDKQFKFITQIGKHIFYVDLR